MPDDRKAQKLAFRLAARRVSKVLFEDWNPIPVPEHVRDDYDSYVPGVVAVLLGSRDEEELAALLKWAEIESMGLGDTPRAQKRRRAVARKLLSQ